MNTSVRTCRCGGKTRIEMYPLRDKIRGGDYCITVTENKKYRLTLTRCLKCSQLSNIIEDLQTGSVIKT